MKKFLILVLVGLLSSFASSANADLVYLIRQLGGETPIVAGDTAQFGIFLGTTVAGGAAEDSPLGVDVRVSLDTGDGSAGLWSAGVNLQAGGDGFDQDAFPTDSAFYVAFWGFPALTFPTLETTHQIATLTLDTTGATPGDYSMSMSEFAALAANFSGMVDVDGGPANYTIVPIPEPSTLGLCCLAAVGLVARRRRA